MNEKKNEFKLNRRIGNEFCDKIRSDKVIII